MIIREKPGPLQLIFAMRGSILPKILPELLLILALSTAITLWDSWTGRILHLGSTPFALFGVALSLFLGFRNNAAYDRWWEARKLVGGLLADSRALAREAELFLPDTAARHRLLRLLLAFHHLHRCALRDMPPDAPATDRAKAAGLAQATPAGALDAMNDILATAHRSGGMDGFGALSLSSRLAAFAHGLTGCERIATTPLPYVYTMLIYRTTWLYCLLLPLALLDSAGWLTPLFAGIVGYTFLGLAEVTEELAQPFRLTENALPMNAICRNAEISLAPHLGERPPAPLAPVAFRLD